MKIQQYIGHESQLYGVEEHRLIGGRGDGMRLLKVRNGLGLEFTVSADRCADISRLYFKGDNFGYFSANGYVSPAYYDDRGTGFLKSFTAGFLTTCGLTAVGSPCEDEGETLPLHGTIGNTPAEYVFWDMDEETITLHAHVNDTGIFSRKLVLDRLITCSKRENVLTIRDTIRNTGDAPSPLMILYHMNMGYPLLSEKAELYIPSSHVRARNAHAEDGIAEWNTMLPPQPQFEEQCYYHEFDKKGAAAGFNPDLQKGLQITFDADNLGCFTEWKMMGVRDYVLGLEPGNCYPDGRDKMRADGRLKIIFPGEAVTYSVGIAMVDGERQWGDIKNKSV